MKFWQQAKHITDSSDSQWILVTRDPLQDWGALEVVVTAARCAATVDFSRQPEVALGMGLERERAKEAWAHTGERKAAKVHMIEGEFEKK